MATADDKGADPATGPTGPGMIPRQALLLGSAALFLGAVWLFAGFQVETAPMSGLIIIAAVIGGYMALNIGANDVANNMGPAVGARVLSMSGALFIAAIFEGAGAIIAGGDVVKTISKGIIDPSGMTDAGIFAVAMLAALFAAALWINLATYVSSPVSTTHSIVGGVMGAGIAAAGISVVDWGTMGRIAMSWVVSPVLGGIIAALFLAFAKIFLLYQPDKIAAARRWVPVLIALMAGVFSAYLMIKGLKQVWKPEPYQVVAVACGVFAICYFVFRPVIARQSAGMENRKRSVYQLFAIPLICSAALLSFAHGSNDVANAVGPLSALVAVASGNSVTAKVAVPLWILFIGAVGIAIGLALFGPKLIRRVGQEITRLNPMRAYCVALSAAITVIAASALGLPVSSTHIAVGAVFGVGFFREYFVPRTDGKSAKKREKRARRKLVRRRHLLTIASAWVITVPISALLAALLYLVFSLFL